MNTSLSASRKTPSAGSWPSPFKFTQRAKVGGRIERLARFSDPTKDICTDALWHQCMLCVQSANCGVELLGEMNELTTTTWILTVKCTVHAADRPHVCSY